MSTACCEPRTCCVAYLQVEDESLDSPRVDSALSSPHPLRCLASPTQRVHLHEPCAEQAVQERAFAAALRAHDGNYLVVIAPGAQTRGLHERLQLRRHPTIACDQLALRQRHGEVSGAVTRGTSLTQIGPLS